MPPKKGQKRALSADAPDITVRIHPKEKIDENFDDDEEEEFFDDGGFDFPDNDPLGYQGEFQCTRSFGGDIMVGGHKAGSFSAFLVDRSTAGSIFYSACDAETAELQEMGCALFSSNGKPRYAPLKADASAKSGGFLYIATFNLDAEHRADGATDVGTAAIRALLSCEALAGRWSVASYIADSSACLTSAEAAAERAQMPRGMAAFRAPPEAPEAKALRIAKINERMAKDARQFLRAGFEEMAYSKGGWLFITKKMVTSPVMTHEAALALPLRLTGMGGGGGGGASSSSSAASSSRAVPTAADASLLEYLLESRGASSASLISQIDSLVAEGADLTRAGALQFCAANDKKDLLQPLLSRGAQINGFDQNGVTPLMVAAMRPPGKTSLLNPQHDATMVAALIALGADKEVLDADGCSALGHYYKAVRGVNDFSATFGMRKQAADATLKAMLSPKAGPTAADKECAD